MNVRGWSTSWRDGVAFGAMVVGVLVCIFTGRSLGGRVFDLTGSLWLATCVWIASLLVGVTLFLGGFAWILSDRRTYRHPGSPEHRSEREKVDAP